MRKTDMTFFERRANDVLDDDVIMFDNEFTPWSYDEIKSAVRHFREAGLDVKKLVKMIERCTFRGVYTHHRIDLLEMAYGHVFELARSRIKLVLNYDMVMDAKADNRISVCGDSMRYACDPIQLQEKINASTKNQQDKLRNDKAAMAFFNKNKFVLKEDNT